MVARAICEYTTRTGRRCPVFAWSRSASRPAVRQTTAREDARTTSPMATGTMKKIISDRGFGFITGEDGKDYFFHRDGLDRSLEFDRLVGGEKVNFEIESSPRGPRAGKVRSA